MVSAFALDAAICCIGGEPSTRAGRGLLFDGGCVSTGLIIGVATAARACKLDLVVREFGGVAMTSDRLGCGDATGVFGGADRGGSDDDDDSSVSTVLRAVADCARRVDSARLSADRAVVASGNGAVWARFFRAGICGLVGKILAAVSIPDEFVVFGGDCLLGKTVDAVGLSVPCGLINALLFAGSLTLRPLDTEAWAIFASA